MQRDPDLDPAVDPVSAILEAVTVERDTARTVATELMLENTDAEAVLLLLEAYVAGGLELPAVVVDALAQHRARWSAARR